MKEQDAAFEGSKIFQLIFEGTGFNKYKGFNGGPNFEGIKPKSFAYWVYCFERCVSDFSDKNNQGTRSILEKWWDALKKIITLY